MCSTEDYKMRLLNKNNLLFALGFIMIYSLIARASTLKVEKISMPIKISNKISQPINLNFAADSNWRILVEPLDSQIRNLDNPNYNLPITRIELAQMNGAPISVLNIGRPCEVKNGAMSGVNNLNLALNAISFESDHPGNYVADIKFTLLSNNSVVAEDVYSFRFMEDTIASIDFTNKVARLSVDKDKILRKNSSQSLGIPVGIYVCSNKNWKLYMRKPSSTMDNPLKYFVKVLGGDYSINCNQSHEFMPLQESPILLASGKSTINQLANKLDKKLINIDYMIKGPADKFIPAGSRSEDFEYRLETED